jgi:hypothetical protein
MRLLLIPLISCRLVFAVVAVEVGITNRLLYSPLHSSPRQQQNSTFPTEKWNVRFFVYSYLNFSSVLTQLVNVTLSNFCYAFPKTRWSFFSAPTNMKNYVRLS